MNGKIFNAIWIETSDYSGFFRGFNRTTHQVTYEPTIFTAKHFKSSRAIEETIDRIKLQLPHAEVFTMTTVWRPR